MRRWATLRRHTSPRAIREESPGSPAARRLILTYARGSMLYPPPPRAKYTLSKQSENECGQAREEEDAARVYGCTGTMVHHEQTVREHAWPGQGGGCGEVCTGTLVHNEQNSQRAPPPPLPERAASAGRTAAAASAARRDTTGAQTSTSSRDNAPPHDSLCRTSASRCRRFTSLSCARRAASSAAAAAGDEAGGGRRHNSASRNTAEQEGH